jgi:hypothetical protein
MVTITRHARQKPNLQRWNDGFLKLLPNIQKQAEYAFRRIPSEPRQELVQETIASAYDMFLRLCRKGKTDLVYATPLTKFAVRHVRAGRRSGSRCNSLDITSPACRHKTVVIERLDRFDNHRGQWRDVLIEDRTAGPAEMAAARIDWDAWLSSLSRRHRLIACSLAVGETTGATARRFQISPARISQLRAWFCENWNQFHAERPERRSTVPAGGAR